MIRQNFHDYHPYILPTTQSPASCAFVNYALIQVFLVASVLAIYSGRVNCGSVKCHTVISSAIHVCKRRCLVVNNLLIVNHTVVRSCSVAIGNS